MVEYQTSQLIKRKHRLAESPAYNPQTGILSWVDILDGKLFLFSVDGRREIISFNQEIGAAVPLSHSDGYIVAAKDGIYTWENGKTSMLYDLTWKYEPYQRSNDAKADSKGRFWFGSAVCDDIHKPCGNLYCLDHGILKCMQEKTKLSNGMAWNSNNDEFFFADSLAHTVYKYRYNVSTGEISGKKALFTVTDGVPDGMCIDAEDNLWVAIWNGSRVEQRCSKTGKKLAEIHVPAKNVTSCCFYGNNLDMLLITTSGEGLPTINDGLIYCCHINGKGKASDLACL